MRQSRGEMHKPTRNKFHRLVAAGYFQPAFEHLYEHWHCGGMLAQLLAFIEGEKHYVRAFDAHHRAGDGGLLLDLHHRLQLVDEAHRVAGGFLLCHAGSFVSAFSILPAVQARGAGWSLFA